MDGQGENIMPNGTGNQVPSDGMPLNIPSHGSNTQANNIAYSNNSQPTAESNVAQHVLGDISSSQPLTTPAEPITTPPEAITTPAAPLTQSAESWTMPSNATISSADVPDPELTPESAPGETARIHAALSHPYFSNHPTQTSASGVGDIVINNRPKSARARRPNLSRGKVITITIAALVVIGVIVMVASGIGRTHSNQATPVYASEAIGTVKEKMEQIQFLEELFYSSQFDNITTDEILSDSVHDKINQSIGSIIKLQDVLNRFSFTESEDSLQQMYIINARDMLNERADKYIKTVDLYNKVFEAYKNDNEEYFNTLSASDNQDESAIGARLVDYFVTKQYWETIIADNNCDQSSTSSTCVEAQKYYDQNQSSLMQNAPIPRMIFSAFIETPYAKSSLVYNDLKLIIEEQSSEK